MNKNTVEAFKKAVKEKFEAEKQGIHSSFLLHVSRAKLRNLCLERMKDCHNPSDLNCFKAFLGFEFHADNIRKLKAVTDKFRPIETFFKGETDLNDIESVNMAAILVDFSPRPFLRFTKSDLAKDPMAISTEISSNTESKINFGQVIDMKSRPISTENRLKAESGFYKNITFRKSAYFAVPLVLIILIFYGYHSINQKQCMQWNADHYEIVHCKTTQLGLLSTNEISPINDQWVTLRKINVCDTTTFFKDEKPIVWYCKKDKKVEFFNGPGYHPESGKPLKPITDYMIKKYVLHKEQIPK